MGHIKRGRDAPRAKTKVKLTSFSKMRVDLAAQVFFNSYTHIICTHLKGS